MNNPIDRQIDRQAYLITKIQNGIKVTDADDVYSCGMRNGMRWCLSLIDDKEPLYENCPSVQPKIKWTFISEKLPDEDIDVLCKTESGFRTIASYGQLYPNDEEKGWITAEFNRFQTNFFAKWRPIIEDDD